MYTYSFHRTNLTNLVLNSEDNNNITMVRKQWECKGKGWTWFTAAHEGGYHFFAVHTHKYHDDDVRIRGNDTTHTSICINRVRPRLMSCESCLKCGAYVICVVLLANSCTFSIKYNMERKSVKLPKWTASTLYVLTQTSECVMWTGYCNMRQLLWWHKLKGEQLTSVFIYRRTNDRMNIGRFFFVPVIFSNTLMMY